MPLERIPKRNVSDRVFDQIKEAIASGEWRQGERIPSENDLAQTLGVSRMTVRSALQKLSSLGVVESRQGEGTYVCALDGGQYINSIIPMVVLENHDALYMLEFRHMLECEAAALAAQRATAEDIDALKQNFAHMMTLDPFSMECSLVDMEFHFSIARMTRNPMLIQVFGVLQDVFLSSIQGIARIMPANNALHYHTALIDAIEARDEGLARAVMAEHIELTMQYLANSQGRNEV